MDTFLQTALTFPVAPLSFLLSVAILYWCIASLGLVEVDVLDGDGASSSDASVHPEGIAGLLLKLGLSGVPVTLVLTLLFFFSWFIGYFAQLLLLSHLPLGFLRYPVGLVVDLAALLLSVPVCGFFVRSLRPLFLKLQANSSTSLLGQVVVVRSGQVTLSQGEATFDDGGAGLILRVRADEGIGAKRGDRVVLLEYLEADNAYRVITEDDFKGI